MDTGSGADKTIQSFLNSLKISLGNASIYAADHPVLLRSLEELQNKLYDILIFFNSIEIFVAPNYLLIDQIKWEKDEVHK